MQLVMVKCEAFVSVVQLEEVNQRLVNYDAWHQQIDSWVIIEVPDPNWVYKWRLQVWV